MFPNCNEGDTGISSLCSVRYCAVLPKLHEMVRRGSIWCINFEARNKTFYLKNSFDNQAERSQRTRQIKLHSEASIRRQHGCKSRSCLAGSVCLSLYTQEAEEGGAKFQHSLCYTEKCCPSTG